ncbi:hypothetical protein MTO96_045662, partial [Rhipicephalus appendiculatus]
HKSEPGKTTSEFQFFLCCRPGFQIMDVEQYALSKAYGRCDSGDAGAFPRHLRMPCTKEGDSDCELLLHMRSTRGTAAWRFFGAG